MDVQWPSYLPTLLNLTWSNPAHVSRLYPRTDILLELTTVYQLLMDSVWIWKMLEKVWLRSIEPSLEAYLVPSYNHSVSSSTTLPSKYCTGISPAAQLEKVYRGHVTTVCA